MTQRTDNPRRPGKTGWAVRSGQTFQKSVEAAVADHHRSGRPTHFAENGWIYERLPNGRKRKVSKIETVAKAPKA